jgi:hypothetical protein
MTEPIAIRSIADLQVALRQRAEQLDVSREWIDAIGGLSAGHSSKLLCEPPTKRMGLMSFNTMLATLGVKLIMVEDPEQMDRIRPKLQPRVGWTALKHAVRLERAKRQRDAAGDSGEAVDSISASAAT